MAMCLTPYYVKNNRYGIDADQISKIPVPCGRCPTCIERRTNQMVLRLTEQEKISTNAIFATLTYANEHCPITKNGFATLRKSDVQKFFKRLRFNTQNIDIKYYVVGEYGTTTRRPHYHAIIFNATETQITMAWGLGGTHYGKLTTNSIAYTCKYMAKQNVHRKQHGRDDRLPEFSLSSQGLGKNYIDKRGNWHKDDLNRNYAVIPGNIKVPLPRYFKEKIYDEHTRKSQSLQAQALSEEKELNYFTEFCQRRGYNSQSKDTADIARIIEEFEYEKKQRLDHKLRSYYQAQEKNRQKL